MKLLIITVGNRQIGWRCQDGQIRCPGSPFRSPTPDRDPIAHLYQELGAERPPGPNGVRQLGELLYQHCQNQQDFRAVELLLDHGILENLIAKKLGHVWLMGTDQPAEVQPQFRAQDTIWLAKLMAGKIRQTWPNLAVKVNCIRCNLADVEAIRAHYEAELLRCVPAPDQPPVTLWIQTKGATPAIGSGLDIGAAMLTREIDVRRVIPKEPKQLATSEFAEPATEFQDQSLSRYFWPLERPKIISAWERGDFGEARIWLHSHRWTHKLPWEVAGQLEQATRQDLAKVLRDVRGQWLETKRVRQGVDPATLKAWQTAPAVAKQVSPSVVIWEASFQIPIHAQAGRWTDAFFLMAQTLERLLVQLYRQDDWAQQRDEHSGQAWIELTPNPDGGHYIPRLEQLTPVWAKRYGTDREFDREFDRAFEAFNQIRSKRNKMVHEAAPIAQDDIAAIWQRAGWAIADPNRMLLEPLNPIAQQLNLPDRPLLSLLYDWGLMQLRAG
jgi:hypothetical protein